MYKIGQLLKLRKKHPCGSVLWEVIKPGVDMRIRCTGCDRTLLIARDKLTKQIRATIDPSN